MSEQQTLFRKAAGLRWDAVDLMEYKEVGSAPFRSITRQTLFKEPSLGCELRYFEVAPGGYSTFERHEHRHAVMILAGAGTCLVGNEIRPVALHDLVDIPAWHWHQFRAGPEAPLGFLCMVNGVRDKPQLPTEAEWAALRADTRIARFLDDAA